MAFSFFGTYFIENKIYRDIEEMTTRETVIKAVDDG
jgi:topoisomerase-4 subunit A